VGTGGFGSFNGEIRLTTGQGTKANSNERLEMANLGNIGTSSLKREKGSPFMVHGPDQHKDSIGRSTTNVKK